MDQTSIQLSPKEHLLLKSEHRCTVHCSLCTQVVGIEAVMAHVLRPLMQLPRLHHHCYYTAGAFYHFLTSSKTTKIHRQLLLINSSFLLSNRNLHLRSRAFRSRDVPLPSDTAESDSDSSSSSDGAATKKSRNEKKREAKRAVRWGTELANFSPPQIKRILSVAALEREVYDALVLVKRLGRDVREGKRRQFNYIGRLLREVEPELMDGLIQATKDGDNDKFQTLCSPEAQPIEDSDEAAEETEDEYEEEDPELCVAVATRWYEGLVNKDIDVMNEIYSLTNVDFDRQELRRLVRKVHVVLERHVSSESEEQEEVNAKVVGAKRALTRFLRGLAKQLPVE